MMDESDSNCDIDTSDSNATATDSPQKKKRRQSEQRFLPAYAAEWPAVVRSKLEFHGFCTLCKCDFSVRHGGRFDIQRHLSTAKHLAYKSSIESTQRIGDFFSKGNVTYSKILAT